MTSKAKATLVATVLALVVSGSGGPEGALWSTMATAGSLARQDSGSASRPSLEVPRGAAPTIDGVLSPGEWDAARRREFTGGSHLLLMHDQGRLYIGMRAHIGSLCLDGGGTIAVLHSSASLGTAVYEKGEAGWKRTREFDWTCRDASDSPEARQAREEHFKRERWVARRGRMGE
jgi:hypothetical protein